MQNCWVITPCFRCDATAAIAANRAGHMGILDLGMAAGASERAAAVHLLHAQVRDPRRFGLRFDRCFSRNADLQDLQQLVGDRPVPWLVLSGIPADAALLCEIRREASAVAHAVAVEATDLATVIAASHASFDAIVLKGAAAGGWVSELSTLEFLKAAHPHSALPLHVQGGLTPEAAAEACACGAAGIVLCEQVWWTRESGLATAERRAWSPAPTPPLQRIASDQPLFRGVAANVDDTTAAIFPLGEDIAIAEALGRECVTVSGVLEKYTQAIVDRQPATVASIHRPPRPATQDIAIVGLAGMFPKAPDARQYWQNILRGVDAVTEVPPDRWDAGQYYDPDRKARDRVYSKWGGFLDAVVFDPLKWAMPPASVASIDTTQLIALEVSWHALKDAGYTPERFRKTKASVIYAASGIHDISGDYYVRSMLQYYLSQAHGVDPQTRERLIADLQDRMIEWTEDSFPGFLLNVIAGRVANRLDFDGTNYTVDAACAASLAGIHAAIQQLRTGASDSVLVGAVDLTNSPFCYMSFAKTHALSPRGRSRPFDASSDGIALGEAVVALLLKRLPDAERDGDRIYAVIRGIGAASDGRARSMTAPHSAGQVKAILRAYDDAGFDPATVSLIEAHGTGTTVGDTTELKSLTTVFRDAQVPQQAVALGSVKSMIGHTKGAAGLASLVKTALALHHRILPGTGGIAEPHPAGEFDRSPMYLNTAPRPWFREYADSPRRAGVSAFGFGGTNFHVALEEYTGAYHQGFRIDHSPRRAELFFWTSADLRALRQQIDEFAELLRDSNGVPLDQLGFSLVRDRQERSADSSHRLAIVATSLDDLRTKLERGRQELAAGRNPSHPSGVYYGDATPLTATQVCFLYPGQGSQSVGMLDWLFRWEPDLCDLAEQANCIVGDLLPRPLTRFIYPVPVFTDEDRLRQQQELDDTAVAQPALGLVETAATQWLARFKIVPGCVGGHSFGEYVALHAAGAITAEQLLSIAALRGKLCAAASKESAGGMAVVAASAADVRTALLQLQLPLHVANQNGPQQTVIAGRSDALDDACRRLSERGFTARRISVTAAFHTPELKQQAAQLAVALQAIPFAMPALPIGSNTLGDVYTGDVNDIALLLGRHLVEPVRFDDMVRRLHDRGARLFIEVGPKSVLTQLVGNILELKRGMCEVVPLDTRDRPDGEQAAHVLALCAARGLPVDVDRWYANRGLDDVGVTAYLQRVRTERTPKPTDWILTPSRSRPVRPLEGVKASAELLRPPANPTTLEQPTPAPAADITKIVQSPSRIDPPHLPPAVAVTSTSNPAPAPLPLPLREVRPAVSISQPLSNSAPVDGTNAEQPASRPQSPFPPSRIEARPMSIQGPQPLTTLPLIPAGADQQTALGLLSRWLDMRNSENRLLERFLDLQFAVTASTLSAETTTPASEAIAAPVHAVAPVAPVMPAAPAPQPAPATQTVRSNSAVHAEPTPVAESPRWEELPRVSRRSLRPTGVQTAVKKAVVAAPAVPVAAAPVARVEVAPRPAAPIAPPKAAPSTAGVPSVEEFRKDLLQVTSLRTGYPVETLDEALPLESGLGIDSIKTVEIFSNLKQYHPFLLNEHEDEDEVLAEFAKLETLGDIVKMYERRSAQHSGNGAAKPDITAQEQNGHHGPHAVRRHVVEAEEAVLVKKNSSSAVTA